MKFKYLFIISVLAYPLTSLGGSTRPIFVHRNIEGKLAACISILYGADDTKIDSIDDFKRTLENNEESYVVQAIVFPDGMMPKAVSTILSGNLDFFNFPENFNSSKFKGRIEDIFSSKEKDSFVMDNYGAISSLFNFKIIPGHSLRNELFHSKY